MTILTIIAIIFTGIFAISSLVMLPLSIKNYFKEQRHIVCGLLTLSALMHIFVSVILLITLL